MKLASLKNGTRDGRLVVVARDLSRFADAGAIAPTMQAAIESWDRVEAPLRALAERLETGAFAGEPFDSAGAEAPLPRAYQWLDGSAFLNHGRLMIKAFGLADDIHAEQVPLMYQGVSDGFIGPCDDIALPSEADGIDFEGEFVVVLDPVPMGIDAARALRHIKLVGLVNDVSLRALARREMDTGFGFLQAKPTSSFAPVLATPDELGSAWADGRVGLDLRVTWNGVWFGHPNGREMSYSFGELVAHAARSRRLSAGTILGSGTVSNADASVGSACISERRALETIESGQPKTGFMRFGDRIRMEALGPDGVTVFGAIDQRVVAAPKP